MGSIQELICSEISKCKGFEVNQDSQPTFEEIGDGNLNDVFRVRGENESSVIVKRSPPYIKILPEYPLSTRRNSIEYRCLVKCEEVCPGYVPKPYHYSKEHNFVFMEDLKDHVIMRKDLIAGNMNMDAVKAIGYLMGCLHRESHVSKLSEQDFIKLMEDFENDDMVSLTEQFIFTKPFNKDDPTNRVSEPVKKKLHLVHGNQKVLDTVSKMKQIFLQKKECLVHGDLHTGSVMVNGSSAKVIDWEFAYVGPAAFDLGLLIANYIMNHYRHMSTHQNHDQHREFAQKLEQACHETVECYLKNMTCTIGDRQQYLDNMMSEVAGFAGCEIVRRIIGVAHVEDIDGVEYAEEDALESGVRLLLGHENIHSIGNLMAIALAMLY